MSRWYTTLKDNKLLQLVKCGDVQAFEMIYDRYVEALYEYVDKRVRDKEESKEIIQEFFEWLWTNRETLSINTSARSYFFGAAKHLTLNHIRSRRIQDKYVSHFTHYMNGHYDRTTEEMLNLSDLETSIERSISELPEKCQEAFRMSRMEHEPIHRIAQRMNISTRTVENYISLALKHLRTSLEKVMIIIILIKHL